MTATLSWVAVSIQKYYILITLVNNLHLLNYLYPVYCEKHLVGSS